MAISEELQRKLDYYEQVYFSLDEPIPFKGDLKLYPVLVKDYYKFYSSYSCVTEDKNVELIPNEFGGFDKIPNVKGMTQTYLAYLIDKMEDKEKGPMTTSQVMQLFELVFHIPKSLYCSECGEVVDYSTIFDGIEESIEAAKQNAQEKYEELLKAQESETGEKIENRNIPDELMGKILASARMEHIRKKMECPHCQKQMRDIFSIKENSDHKKILVIKDIEINAQDFDEFKAIIPRQNIIDYDGDKYIDPDLKEELEIKARLQNKDYTSPTLEKQLVCVSIGTGISLKELHDIPMRKLSMYLRLIDREKTYYAQLQASMSGMVEFKEPPKHWIFSDDKKNIKDELTNYDNFKGKFDKVT